MSKQAFAVRQGERELGCLWQMETIRVSLFHVSCGRNFSMLLSNRSKRCQRVRDEVSTVFIRLRRYIYIIYIYIPGFIKRVPEPGPTISPDPDFRPSPGPLFVEDLTARVVRAQPPASGLLAGIKLNSLFQTWGVSARLKSCNFDKGGGKGGGDIFQGA